MDHRTLEAQRLEAVAAGDFGRAAELDREPEPKVGWEAWQLERKGVETERGDMLRAVIERNEERRAVYERVGAAGGGERARFLELREELGDALEAFLAWGTEVAERARAFARGAMVAGTVGLAGLGLLPERDSVVPAAPPTVEAPLSLEDEIVEGVLEDLAVEAWRRRSAQRSRRWATSGRTPATSWPTRTRRTGSRRSRPGRRRTAGERRRARHEALDDVEDLDADVGRAERQRKEEERLAEIGAMARAERAEVEGTGLERTYPPDALAIEDPPERTDATDDRSRSRRGWGPGPSGRATSRADPRGAAEDGAGTTRPPAALVGARGRDR